MLERMAYLRLKRLRLGPTYERFLAERLSPGGTIILLECSRDWRTTQVADRTYFQFGALGGVPEEEYFDGGERIAEYLARQGSQRWRPPRPDARRPEAEWGFDPALRPDVEHLARRAVARPRRLAGPRQRRPHRRRRAGVSRSMPEAPSATSPPTRHSPRVTRNPHRYRPTTSTSSSPAPTGHTQSNGSDSTPVTSALGRLVAGTRSSARVGGWRRGERWCAPPPRRTTRPPR